MKACVIGCGRIGAESSNRFFGLIPDGWLPLSHIESVLSIKELNLVGICDTNEDLLKKWGSHYSIANLHKDFRNMINIEKPEIVTIATRTPVRAEIVKYLCAHDVKGIYVEKPIANSIQECEEILSEVDKANIKLEYGVNRRYHTTYRQAKQMIQDGCIGEILEIFVEHDEAKLLWSHPHSVDLILFFSDSTSIVEIQSNIRPDSITTLSELYIESDPVIDSAKFVFSQGITAYITKAKGHNIRICGTKGNLSILSDGSCIRLENRSSSDSAYFLNHEAITPSIAESATVNAIKNLMSSIQTNSAQFIHPREIKKGMQMLIGCVWSHLNGGTNIKIQDIPGQLKVMGKYQGMYA